MNVLLALTFVVALTILGWLILHGLSEPSGGIERMGLAYPIGVGVFTFALWLPPLFGISFSPTLVIVIYLLLGAFAFVWARRNSSRETFSLAHFAALDPFELAALGLIALIFLVVCIVALYWSPHVWDELAIWALKGKLIAANVSPSLAAHPYYPLNLPYQIASLYALGSESVHFISVTYLGSLALIFFAHLREWSSRRNALLATTVLCATPFFMFQSTIAYANLPFTFYYIASTLYLIRFLKTQSVFALVFSALLLGFGAWTRAEAPLYFAINFATLIIFSLRTPSAKKHGVAFAAVFIALAAPWTLYAEVMGYGGLFSAASNSAREGFGKLNLDALNQTIRFMLQRPFLFKDWGTLWLALPLALILGWRQIHEHKILLTLIALNIVGIIYTFYAVAAGSAANLLEWSLSNGFDRLAMQWAPLIVFYFGLALHKSSIMENVIPMPRIKLDPYFILLLLFSLFAIGPLLGPGYFWGAHDGRHSVYFLFEFDRAIQDGVWYPRWAPDFTFGFGYPFFNIYAPGAFYIGEFFHLLGFDFVTATKIVFALAMILAGPAMFAFVKRLTGSSQAAFLSGLVYVYVPYHIVDIYVRAALAELVALIFLPLTLWGFYETVVNPSRKALVAAALAYGAMHLSHNGVALLFTPVLIAWILFQLIGKIKRQEESLRIYVLRFTRAALVPFFAALLGVGLAAIFVVPAVLEYQFVRTDQWLSNYYDYTNHFAYLFQLFSPFWDFGISVAGPKDQMSFQFGVVPALLAIFAIYSIFKNPNGMRRYWLFFVGLTFVTIALMLSFSLPLWETLRLVTFAQFPWRLLTLTNVSLAILAGAIAPYEPTESPNHPLPHSTDQQTTQLSLPTVLFGILIVLGSFPYLTAPTTVEAAEGPVSILGLLKFQQSAGEMTGVSSWVEEIPTWSPMADVYFAGRRVKSKIEFSDFNPDVLYFGVKQDGTGLRSNGETVEFDAQDANQIVTWNIDYYPGWHVYLADKVGDDLKITRELPITREGKYARIQVSIPQGRHWLLLRFEDTLPRIVGMWISAASILIALGLLFIKRKN